MVSQRIYLGEIDIALPGDLEHTLDHAANFGANWILKRSLRQKLEEIWSLAPVSSVQIPTDNDLAIDIHVSKYLKGWTALLSFIPLIQRQELEIEAKLYHVTSGKTVSKHALKETSSWDRHLRGQFKFRLPGDSAFQIEEMELLAISISLKLMDQILNSEERQI